MAQPKFKLTSLEEDFKRIGILTEGEAEQIKPATGTPPGVPLSKEDTIPKGSAPKAEKETDDTEDDAEKKDDKESEKKAKVDSAPVASEEDVEVDEDIAEEERDNDSLSEGLKLKMKKRLTSKDKQERRKASIKRKRNSVKNKRKTAMWRKSSKGKNFLRKYKAVVARFGGKTPKGKRLSLKMGYDRISNLIEEVQDIVEGIDNDSKQETVKSFANLAIISDKLAEDFKCACRSGIKVETTEGAEIDFCGASSHFENIAGDAADLAEALNESMQEGIVFEGTAEQISDTFNAMISDVLEGLELHSMVEDEEYESDDSDSDEKDSDEKDSDEKDSDEKDSDEKDSDEKDSDEKDSEPKDAEESDDAEADDADDHDADDDDSDDDFEKDSDEKDSDEKDSDEGKKKVPEAFKKFIKKGPAADPT